MATQRSNTNVATQTWQHYNYINGRGGTPGVCREVSNEPEIVSGDPKRSIARGDPGTACCVCVCILV